jgi:peptidoglycan hydrolase CwlO-like protein
MTRMGLRSQLRWMMGGHRQVTQSLDALTSDMRALQARVDALADSFGHAHGALEGRQLEELDRIRAAVEAAEKRAAAAELAADRVALAAAAAAAAAAATASAANPDAASCEHQGSPLSTQSRVRSLAPPQSCVCVCP